MADYGLGSWPSRRARIRGGTIALRQDGRELSYTQLSERVEHLARALADLGVRHGDRIAYLGLNDIATFEVFFAAGRLGAIFVPLNNRLSAPEVAYLLDDAEPRVLFCGPEHADLIAAVDPRRHGVRTIITCSGPGSLAELVEGGALLPDVRSDVALTDDAVILYTSGTTGRPKGAVLTHANLTFNTMNQLAHVDVLSTDTTLCMCPLFHATGLGQVSLPTLFKGGTVVVVPKFDAGGVLSAIARLGVTSFSAVPTMLQMLCDHPTFANTDLSSLRFAIYGGSMVAERVAVAWQSRGVQILQGYGMTEASPGVFLATPDGAMQRPVSVGVPQFFTDITVRPVPAQPDADGSGELLVCGLNVFRGYWNLPSDAFDTDGWFRSGDVLRVAEDGWAYVVDRIKDMIISGGENIYPAEVEAAINALPGIVDSAVVGIPDDRWGEVGLAFVISETARTEASLRAALATHLATFKIPKRIRFVDALPRNATGKVRKQELRTYVTEEMHLEHNR
ncbi:MAG: fatty-acyl-CoA synthase [Pseudonocardiales bacterium]|jgi:fatty-acyl-CoA synthase|nr:fatty-acyl-CoA synthase [Pseudonocardiales bacterium]